MLFDQFSMITYDVQEAAEWNKDIVDLIREKVKDEIHSFKINNMIIK